MKSLDLKKKSVRRCRTIVRLRRWDHRTDSRASDLWCRYRDRACRCPDIGIYTYSTPAAYRCKPKIRVLEALNDIAKQRPDEEKPKLCWNAP